MRFPTTRGLGWVGLASLLLLSCLLVVQAHRLDECLQAARIEVSRTGLLLELDVTPGLDTLSGILPLIDVNGDGKISPTESEAYADLVRRGLTLHLNGRSQVLQAIDVVMPVMDDLKAGVGVIRLKLKAEFRPLRLGRHVIRFENRHLTGVSVYLVNALVPQDSTIQIQAQRRDPLQRKFELEFTVNRPRQPKGKTG